MRRLFMMLLFILHYFLLINIYFAQSRNMIDVMKNRPFNNSISAIYVFGDSTVDPGNNNYVHTVFKSNFPPYGMDFPHQVPTGRFTDGRVVTDFIASYIGIKEFIPAYLDSSLSLEELMTGVSFASAGSGFDPLTSLLTGVISVPRQLEYFKEYKAKLEGVIGKERTDILISNAAFLISAGTNDIVLNYFATPFRRRKYDITSYEQLLLHNTQQLIQGLMEEGARVIGLVGLPPIGCLPIVITFTSGDAYGRRPCTDALSSIALDYNQKLQSMLAGLENPMSMIVYADIYQPLLDMIQQPSQFGFDNSNTGCCGTGFVETSFLCNKRSLVCSDPTKYVFFDSVHPTEASYKYIFRTLRPTIDRIINNHLLL